MTLAEVIARRLGDARDRATHRWLQRRAVATLSGRHVQRIVVMCHGNICRSPFAAAVLRRELEHLGRPDVVVTSFGVIGPDRPPPPHALSVGAELGVDLSTHRSSLISSGDLRSTDLVVVMSADQASDVRWRGVPAQIPVVVLGDFDPKPIESRTIFDPWNSDEDVFRDSYRRIDRCIRELARTLCRAAIK